MNQRISCKLAQALMVLIFSLLSACGVPAGTISGKIVESDGQPVSNAFIYLVAYKDENAARQESSQSCTEELIKAFTQKQTQADICDWKAISTYSNNQGQYNFSDVTPGWYKLLIAWGVKDQIGQQHSENAFERAGDFLVMYSYSDESGYHAFAQGKTFNLPEKEGLTINLELTFNPELIVELELTATFPVESQVAITTGTTFPDTPTPLPLFVFVTGAVAQPNTTVQLPPGSTWEDVLHAAGGATLNADLSHVDLTAQASGGGQFHVPEKPEAEQVELIHINRADIAQLEALPGIGPTMAQNIIEFQEANGPFASWEDLLNVPGLSERLLERWHGWVVFD